MGTAKQYAQQSTMRKHAPWSLLFKRSSELLLVLAVYCFCVMLPVPVAEAQVAANTPVFGPQTYTRTTGAPNEYTTTFTAPPWIVSPFNLHIVNGDASGKNRISSATIALNGVQIAGPSDFNQNVATIDRSATLQATNTLQVTLASKPGSYLTINVYGTNGDHTAPQIKIVTPAGSSYINTASPNIEVTYSDPVGMGEPGASGVNVSTIKATLDGVDRTNLFTVRSGDASATIPANLALSAGAHTLVFSLQDKAGNQATATAQFTVDLGVPRIQISQPVLGAYLNTTTPAISIQYSDSFGVNLSSLKVLINGVDETSLFTKTNTGATATLPAGNALPQGANQLVAQIQNLAGTQATASTSFNIDTTAPVISFAHPTPNSYHGSSTVEIMVQYSDDQALDTSTLRVTLDGAAISTTITPTSASGVASAVANGAHLLVGTVKDLAGNAATSQITFYVDTTVPTIHVSQPAPNAIVSNSTPQVSIDYSDILGVNTSTLKVFVNGADATTLFSVGASSATGHLSGTFSLPDGQNTIIAQVANFAGTLGTATSTFIIDTTPPTLAFQAPPARTNSNTPTVTLSYSDSGSGVNPFSLAVAVDGVDVSALIAPGASTATGVLQLTPPLSDGTHQLSATITDRAGNKSQPATLSFVVDTIPPVVSFSAPVSNSFLNNPTPSITLQYSDGTGTGVATSSIQILLQQGTNPPTDITSYFQIGPQQATGAIPAAVALNDGTYVLSAVVNDLVGNPGGAHTTFVVDTVPPTSSIQSPAASAVLNASAVTVVLVYNDDRSGVDTSKLVLTVDGVNQTAVLTIGPAQATGTLPVLPDGIHTIQLIVVDRSGNSAVAISQAFTTDTIAPTITAAVTPAPNSAGWNNSNVTVTFTCADGGSGVQTCPSPVVVTTEGTNQSTCGQAVDIAGNTSAPFCVTLNIDKTSPTITASISPAPNANGINTSTPVTISFTCSDALSGIAVCPSPISVTTTGMSQVFGGTAADKAGNNATSNVTLNIQTVAPTPPSITVLISPAPNSKGWNNSNVTVSFACAAGTNPLATCPAPVVVSTEGANQSICGKAIDNTGLSATACASVNLDRTPPTIAAAASPAPLANTWNTTPVTVTFTCADSLSGVATCPPSQTISSDGFHQVVSGTATDVAGNISAPVQLTLNIDQTPPSILQFTAPSQLAPGQSGTATVNATDNIGVASVVIQLNGATVATLTTVPYTTTFTAPTTANAGDTLTLTASVFDAAGNVNSSARGIQVVPAGVVTGQVLSDATGLPFTGAAVQVLGATAQDTSDNSGRYSIASNSAHLFLSISSTANATTGAPAMVSVEREVFLKAGVGTVPVDARMTQIAAAIPINAAGGSLKNGSITISVAPGAVSSATNFHLTSLSQQGLPGLLPLGWSPVAAFDLRADTSTSASFTASLAQLPNSVALHLVRYDYNSHSWLMVTPNLGAVSGALTIPVPSVGGFALVTPDGGNTSLTVPSAGQALSGVSMVTLPAGAAATGVLNPPSVSPTGGTSAATLTLQSSVPLPSGTVIQAKVQDTYSLVSGKHLSQAPRLEDIILYQFAAPTGAAAAATFPVTPAQTFQPGKLASGDVHLDILSGRESVRGQVGGSDSVSVTGGDATLTVAAGSLPQDTAISVAPEGVDTFLPSTATLLPLAEYNIDLSGQTLLSAAQLSVAAGSAKTGDTLVLAQIQRIQGAPYLVVVSLAQVTGSNLVTQAAPGLSGITQGGDYVFYKLTSPTGYVSGTVNASTGPVPALVQTDGLPFVAFSSSAGSYVIVALAGPVNLTASVPNTALSGTAAVQVTAGQTTTQNITLVGQTESATIAPPNGAVGVPLTAEIDITAPDAFNPVSITATSVTLTQNGQGTSTPVPVRFVFSQGNTRLSVFPLSALQPSTTYTLAASGLANVLGGLVAVPTATFTTKAITPPNFNPDALVFSMPDQNGNVQVSAPAGSFPSGSTILIIDQTNGVVLSLTVFNDGSVSGQFPATIDDVLSVTITAPDKTTTSFTRSQFVAPDGTTAVGPGGGTVTGPGNTGLIIPQGALNKGTTFKLTPLDQTAFPVLPTFPGMIFGSGLHVDAPAMPVFSQEVKIAFPVPANAPSNAVYYVYRRITDQAGNVSFDTIDQAFVQGTGTSAQVVTASPPFCGYRNAYGAIQGRTATEVIAAVFQPFVDFIVLMEIPVFDANQPGAASQGLIIGKALQVVPPPPGQSSPSFVPVDGAIISLDSDPSRKAITSGSCGTFALFDPKFGGGARNLTANFNGQMLQSVAYEVNAFAQAGAQDAQFGPFGINAGTQRQYKNIGTVTFTFAAPIPPPPPPQISIGVYTLDNNGNRQPISGIVTTGTSLVLTFASSSTIQVVSASIDGSPFSTVIADKVPPPNPAIGYYTLTDQYVAPAPGLHTIVASAINPLSPNDAPITETRGFLVVQVGGSNTVTTTDPPGVISSDPQNNAQNVDPISTTPSLTFSEPVTNVTGNVTMTGLYPGDPAHIQLVGLKTDGTIANPVQPTDKITSLTILHDGLQYSDVYTIALSNSIVDLNGKLLAPPYKIVFNTYVPTQTGSTQSNNLLLTRPAIIGDRAYFGGMIPGGSGPVLGGPDVVDISDPASPKDLGIPTAFVGRVTDLAGQEKSPVTPGSLLAISATFAIDNFIPSNIWLYQVPSPDLCPVSQAPPACPSPLRIGAVSASSSATQAGTAIRLAIKDNFLYSSTSLQGLQVIDLQQALADYTAATPTEFGQAVSTEGQGFAMDAIVNTIRIPTTTGGTYTMFGLQAGDFLLGNSGGTGAAPSQTLLVATGGLPFVVVDPFKSGPAAVLYPPQDPTSTAPGGLSNVPLIFTTPGLTTYQLNYGAATALGTITTDTNGTSTSRNVAVVVGSGSSSASGPGSFLAVVDMSQPYVPGAPPPYVPGTPYLPKPIGFLKLAKGPTDVLIFGNYAAVGTGTDVLLVDLADPTNPKSAGTIKGSFGNKLAMTAQGILVASGTIPGSPSPSTVQTASLDAFVRPDDLSPIFAKISQGDPYDSSSNPMYQLLSDVTITVSLHPSNLQVATGRLFLSGNNFSQTVPLQFNSTTGQALVTLPKGTSLPPLLSARPSVVSRDRINAFPNQYTAGTASMLIDANNNSVLDFDPTNSKNDRAQMKAGKAFGFWQADSTILGTQEALTDYAMIQLKIDALPTPDQGILRLRLQGSSGTTGLWALVANQGIPIDNSAGLTSTTKFQKFYLSNQTIAQTQLGLVAPGEKNVIYFGGPPDLPNGFTSLVDCSYKSSGGGLTPLQVPCFTTGQTIDLQNLQPGVYNLLFKCFYCLADTSRTLNLEVDKTSLLSATQIMPVDPPVSGQGYHVDIRPIQGWIGAFSARDQDPPTPTAQPVPGWNNTVPPGANVTVLVHGYSVSQDDALTKSDDAGQAAFVPSWAKRLYWSASPVLPVQMVGTNPAYTVGFVWQGDFVKPKNIPIISRKIVPLFFPDDTFRALESGTPLADLFMNKLKPNAAQINVIAHSMGNYVVNTALTQVPPQTVTNYIMNESAVPADAFYSDSNLMQAADQQAMDATSPFMLGFLVPIRQDFTKKHLAQVGQTDNTVWTQLLAQVKASPKTMTGYIVGGDGVTLIPVTVDGPRGVYEKFYNLTDDQVDHPATNPLAQAAETDYTQRWQFQAGQNYGPWLGYYASNLKNTNIINSFNKCDCVVDNPFLIKQLVQSPDREFSKAISQPYGNSIDDLNYAFANPTNPFPTANLTDNLYDQQWLLQPPSSPALYGNQANYIRWTRLAYWYPSTSTGVGAFGFPGVFPNNIDMTPFVNLYAGQIDSQWNTSKCYNMPAYLPTNFGQFPFSDLKKAIAAHPETHGYLRAIPLPAIWKGYKAIRSSLYRSLPDPDPAPGP
jgi:hypothetical protein